MVGSLDLHRKRREARGRDEERVEKSLVQNFQKGILGIFLINLKNRARRGQE